MLTLILLTAIALIVMSYFVVTRREAEVSGAHVSGVRAEFGERAAYAEAKSLLVSLTGSDDYLVSSVNHRPSPDDPPVRYTFISTPGPGTLEHTPLFSGGSVATIVMPSLDDADTSDLASSSPARPDLNFAAGPRADPIENYGLLHLQSDGSTEAEDRFPELAFQPLDAPTAVAGEKPSQIQTRYTWWIEDLEGYPNLDVAGTWTDYHLSPDGELSPAPYRPGYSRFDPRTAPEASGDGGLLLPLASDPGVTYQFPRSFRGQQLVDQVAPGLSTRELSFQPWTTASISISDHPFAEFSPAKQVGTRVASRFAIGLSPYRVIPKIPYGHNYVDEGRERYPLNKLIAERDFTIRDIIEANLPEFADRGGGHPAETDYLSALAANAIDYADEDNNPTLPANVTNGPADKAFRGVDAYCPINEFFVAFCYTANRVAPGNSAKMILEFEARIYAEFWNTFDEPVEIGNLTLDFQFLDNLQFKSQALKRGGKNRIANWNTLQRDDVELNEPLSLGFSLALEPNEIRVDFLGTIKWKTEVERAESEILSSEIPSLKIGIEPDRAGKHSNPKANFELFHNGTLIDTQGRTVGWDGVDGSVPPRHGFFFNTTEIYRYPSASGRLITESRPLTIEKQDPAEEIRENQIVRVSMGNRKVRSGNTFGSHLGDPWMNYYSSARVNNSSFGPLEYERHASPGYRNIGFDFLADRDPDEKDIYGDQTRVRDWPDRGYENALRQTPEGRFTSGPPEATVSDESDDPDLFPFPTDPAFAPWRLSQQGRYFTVTELGNLHDPIMWPLVPPGTSSKNQRYDTFRETWLSSLPADPSGAISSVTSANGAWGGGNSLRIGRPEHERFDRPGMRASQLLDLFHTGINGTNLSATGNEAGLYRFYDPRDHQPPPTAVDPAEADLEPWSLLYDGDAHAQSRFREIYGHLNLNSAPTAFEIEALLRGPFSANASRRLQAAGAPGTPLTPRYTNDATEGQTTSGLKPSVIPLIAEDLIAARPFLSPSHLARVLSYLIEIHEALPSDYSDAEAEETFARILNTTSFSSRHFRIFTYAETYHIETDQVLSRRRSVYEMFLKPVRDNTGAVTNVSPVIISSRKL